MKSYATKPRHRWLEAAVLLPVLFLGLIQSAQSQGRVYWAEPEHSAVRSIGIDGSSPSMIAQGIWMLGPTEIDADAAGWIYWTDVHAFTIGRARADGSNPEILLESVNNPYGLAIDQLNGQMYWTEKGLIRRADLDGSKPVDLVTDFAWPYALEVFPEEDMMFWTVAHTTGGGVYRSKLDGSNIQKISDKGEYFLALEKSTRSLFLPDGKNILRMDLAGENEEVIVESDDYVQAVGVEEGGDRLCWSFFGGFACSHTDGTNPAVVAGTDFPVSSFSIDPKSRLITFTIGTSLAGRIMRCRHDGSGIEDLVDPVVYPIDVAVDPVEGMAYWVDSFRGPIWVYRSGLYGSAVEEIPITVQSEISWREIYSVAVDPVSRRLYVGLAGAPLFSRGGILAGSIDGPVDEDLLGNGDITDIVVDPLGQFLYYVNKTNHSVNRIGTDGSNPTGITGGVAGGLALSLKGDASGSNLTRRLYWIDSERKSIVSANVDGSDLKVVVDGLTDVADLAIDDYAGLLIWSEQGSGILKRAKLDGSEIQTIATSDSRIVGITAVSSPSEATLEYPPPLATGLPTSLTLDWMTPPISARSEVQVASGNQTEIVFASNTPYTDAWFDAPFTESDYFWRTRVVSAGGSGPWTTWSKFSVGSQGALAVTLTDPPDGATGVAVEPELAWESAPSAVKYRLQVSTTESFEEFLIDVDSLTSTTFVPAPLGHETAYFWRVAGIGENGASTFSGAWSFETIIAAPDAVTLISPAAGETGVAAYAEFSWESVDAADSYLLEVALDDQFVQPVVSMNLAETAYGVDVPLAYDTPYFWRVQADNEGGAGPWSEVRTFRTAIGTAVDNDDVPTDYELYQNYPNPFNPTTAIRFAIPEPSRVKLSVFDLRGREVSVLVDGAMPAGRHVATFDAGELPSGVYLYKLTAGVFERTRTMTVVK